MVWGGCDVSCVGYEGWGVGYEGWGVGYEGWGVWCGVAVM